MFQVIDNHLKLLWAKPGTIVLLIMLPLVLFSAGLLSSGGSKEFYLGLIDHDQTELTRAIGQSLSGDTIRLEKIAPENMEEVLSSKQVDAVLIMPQGFQASVLRGDSGPVELVTIQGREMIRPLQAAVEQAIESYADTAGMAVANVSELFQLRRQMLEQGVEFRSLSTKTNPSQGLQTAGGFLFYVLSVGMLQVSGLIMGEKQWNTLNRIRVSPIGRFSYVLANLVTGCLFLFINLLSLWLLTRFVFGITTTVPIYMLWFFYGMVWIFIGILIALVVRKRTIYSAIAPIVTTLFSMIGGSFWPVWTMPSFMRTMAKLTPQYWANDSLANILKGVALSRQTTNLAALGAFLGLALFLAVLTMRRQDKVETFV